MKNFAIFTIVLTALGMLIGFIMLVSGNGAEQAVGAALLESGFTGVLLSCAVIALADIRDAITSQVHGEKSMMTETGKLRWTANGWVPETAPPSVPAHLVSCPKCGSTSTVSLVEMGKPAHWWLEGNPQQVQLCNDCKWKWPVSEQGLR